MPAQGLHPARTTQAIRARQTDAPSTSSGATPTSQPPSGLTTFTPDPQCAIPGVRRCSISIPYRASTADITCYVSVYYTRNCDSTYDCYPPGASSSKYLLPSSMDCPHGWKTAGYRKPIGTIIGGVACCPVGHTYGTECTMDITEGTVTVVPNILEQCTVSPSTYTIAPGQENTITYVDSAFDFPKTKYDYTTAVGTLQFKASAQPVWLDGHTLTGDDTTLTIPTSSAKWSPSPTSTPKSYYGGLSAAQMQQRQNIQVGVGVGVSVFVLLLAGVATWYLCRRRKRKAEPNKEKPSDDAGHDKPEVHGDSKQVSEVHGHDTGRSLLPEADSTISKSPLEMSDSTTVYEMGGHHSYPQQQPVAELWTPDRWQPAANPKEK